jgi:hypothetical protein
MLLPFLRTRCLKLKIVQNVGPKSSFHCTPLLSYSQHFWFWSVKPSALHTYSSRRFRCQLQLQFHLWTLEAGVLCASGWFDLAENDDCAGVRVLRTTLGFVLSLVHGLSPTSISYGATLRGPGKHYYDTARLSGVNSWLKSYSTFLDQTSIRFCIAVKKQGCGVSSWASALLISMRVFLSDFCSLAHQSEHQCPASRKLEGPRSTQFEGPK